MDGGDRSELRRQLRSFFRNRLFLENGAEDIVDFVAGEKLEGASSSDASSSSSSSQSEVSVGSSDDEAKPSSVVEASSSVIVDDKAKEESWSESDIMMFWTTYNKVGRRWDVISQYLNLNGKKKTPNQCRDFYAKSYPPFQD